MKAEDIRLSEILARDPETGFPMAGPMRFMPLSMPIFVRLQDDMIRALGIERTRILTGRLGYEMGMKQGVYLSEMYDFDSKEELFKAASIIKGMVGVAHEELTQFEYDPGRNYVRFKGAWRRSFAADAWLCCHPPSSMPVCAMLSGATSALAGVAFGFEVLVKEITCRAQGHEYCTFEGRSVEDWGMTVEEVRRLFDVENINDEVAQLQVQVGHYQEERARQEAEIRKLRNSVAHACDLDHGLVHRSPAMGQSISMAEKVAPTGSTVLIQGESGTGKEVLARLIHDHSGRRDAPFMAINCAALPANLLESELFGHKKGSFTGADADKKGLFVEAGRGTLFLDEIGELPLEIQAKLLRALQEREVRPVGGARDVRVEARILAATNRELADMVAAGQFREDLYYRLAVFPINVPPLRDRREDILPLARHFLEKYKKGHPGFTPQAVRTLEAYSWPGNVRELENWVEYAVILSGADLIAPDHLPLSRKKGPDNILTDLTSDLPSQEEMEIRYMKRVLAHTGGNRKEAAAILDVSPSTLWRRLKEAGLPEG
jgi:transcriptional regulator with PAS, ATPase and Fis domain